MCQRNATKELKRGSFPLILIINSGQETCIQKDKTMSSRKQFPKNLREKIFISTLTAPSAHHTVSVPF